jgi:DNA repair exonuclease SbcCD nuclease subunit
MALFLIRPSRVLGGWISRYNQQTHQKISGIQSPLFGDGQRFTISPRRQIHITSSLNMARWSIGDSVLVRIKDKLVDASITETRGSGWYAIQLMDTNTSMKCRSSQLLPCTNTATLADTVKTFTAQNRTRPTVSAEIGSVPAYVSPPPTIYDLDAAVLSIDQVSNRRDRELMEQVIHHSSFEKWVAFTDLHCSPASLDTCLKVLAEVHRVALEQNAGVLFLGDFWHHRGTLRVDCLNAVLEHFRSWNVPMIMIPGNHDQVTLGGHSHGLTPIENAYRVGPVSGPLVLSHPTKFRNALFIPHIRDIGIMESVLQSSAAHECSSLFIHAEVTGALMNDLLVSTGGVPPASFPPNKRVYSGHFHKPHTVKSSNVDIEYLGSPYETSLAEAQQAKMLAILDKDWKCIEYFPLNIGRRHFKISNWKELLQLNLPTAEIHDHYHSQAVKAGDRIVLSMSKEDAVNIQPSVGAHINMLREASVIVEVREVKSETLDRSELRGTGGVEQETMTPESTWRAFLDEETERLAISEENAQTMLKAGFEVLEEIESTGEVQTESNQATDLRLKSVFVEGFGPFQGGVTYPLMDRGLVLLKGTNYDSGSDR